ncbi:hypothetical protein N7471_013545, partial [Penicillium samsonianum]|uniref:uncharacterized protein n=1 Tax=Penicillium samsonianum TaxID=1882272 RepID=UPI002546C812
DRVIFVDSQVALKALRRPHLIRQLAERGNSLNRYIRLAAAAKRRYRSKAKIEWERAWINEKTSRATRRLIEAPTKNNMEYWLGLRKATTSILIAYLNRINRRDSARHLNGELYFARVPVALRRARLDAERPFRPGDRSPSRLALDAAGGTYNCGRFYGQNRSFGSILSSRPNYPGCRRG